MTPEATIELAIFADYFQFYIQDETANDDFGSLWTDEAVERLFAASVQSVGVGTVRNMTVPVVVSLHAQEPPADFGEWDMVNEGSFTVRSGSVAIAGCTDYLPDAPRLSVPPGSYRVRASYAGLDTVSEDGLEGDDFYRVQLWPAPTAPLAVVKARSGAAV
ncbi:hypothetical protein J2Y55_004450 [Bosea sp. BE125]|uniref:hypothetical protein n=1 Tax=Bosea sp. BE125 TaxID=2817909 RepID=UPI00286559DC|nr:hypothetical protein [Bosea sp. BE125]MDR6873426.1 hypothetical protein [Bosea sp. BE125]